MTGYVPIVLALTSALSSQLAPILRPGWPGPHRAVWAVHVAQVVWPPSAVPASNASHATPIPLDSQCFILASKSVNVAMLDDSGRTFQPPYDVIPTSSRSSPRIHMPDHEGLIPAQPEYCFVVDCPSLHIVSGNYIGPRRQVESDPSLSTFEHAFCPQCREVITRSRQLLPSSIIPSPGLDSPVRKLRFGEEPWISPPYYPSIPEVVPAQTNSPVPASISPSAANTPKRGFFARLISPSTSPKTQRPPRPPESVTSANSAGSTLPKYLSFSFSLSGQNLTLWKKDSQALVHIEIESLGSRLLDLTDMLPASDGAKVVNIRYVAEGNDWISAVISHNRRLVLLVLHTSGLREESRIHFIEEQFDPKALAISIDNSFIAVGFGPRIHLFHYQGCHQQWHTILNVPDFITPAEVKFQVLNFSSDNSTLVAATQRHDMFRSPDDDTIATYVWTCTKRPSLPKKMAPCKMPTDGPGLNSIYHSPTLSLSLILGGSPTPYPIFLAPASAPPHPIPNTITEFRIRCACLSPPPNNHIAYIMDVKNKVFKIDLRSRKIAQIGDLNMERGALTVREEPAAIGVTQEGKVRLFWRQGGGLWVCALRGEGAVGVKKEKNNLRALWEDAGGGG